jgi:hypothetical protein
MEITFLNEILCGAVGRYGLKTGLEEEPCIDFELPFAVLCGYELQDLIFSPSNNNKYVS